MLVDFEYKKLTLEQRVQLLTSAQKRVYHAIKAFIYKNGYSPTVIDLKEMLGSRSPNAPYEIIKRLHKKGVIKKVPGVSRGILLVEE